MTVRELINSLSTIQDKDNTIVMVKGYEGGYDDIDNIPEVAYMALDVNKQWYYGKHKKVDTPTNYQQGKHKIVKAIVLQYGDMGSK